MSTIVSLLRMCSVLFLHVVIVAESDDHVTDRRYCPVGQYGYFANPSNCSRYAQCADGRLTVLHQCPSNRHWHVTGPGYGFCDLPQSARCQPTAVPDPLDAAEPVKTAWHYVSSNAE